MSLPFSTCQYPLVILEATGSAISAGKIGPCDGPVLTLTIQRKSDGRPVVHTVCDGHAKRLRAEGFEFTPK